MSFLFHKTHEQNYVAHVMAYALCAGPYKDYGDCKDYNQGSESSAASKLIHPMQFANALLLPILLISLLR